MGIRWDVGGETKVGIRWDIGRGETKVGVRWDCVGGGGDYVGI